MITPRGLRGPQWGPRPGGGRWRCTGLRSSCPWRSPRSTPLRVCSRAGRQRDCKFNPEASTTHWHNFKIRMIFYHVEEIRATSRCLKLTHRPWTCPSLRIWHGRITPHVSPGALRPGKAHGQNLDVSSLYSDFSTRCRPSRVYTGWHEQFLQEVKWTDSEIDVSPSMKLPHIHG